MRERASVRREEVPCAHVEHGADENPDPPERAPAGASRGRRPSDRGPVDAGLRRPGPVRHRARLPASLRIRAVRAVRPRCLDRCALAGRAGRPPGARRSRGLGACPAADIVRREVRASAALPDHAGDSQPGLAGARGLDRAARLDREAGLGGGWARTSPGLGGAALVRDGHARRPRPGAAGVGANGAVHRPDRGGGAGHEPRARSRRPVRPHVPRWRPSRRPGSPRPLRADPFLRAGARPLPCPRWQRCCS